jgi:hypothetical protein
MTAMEKKQPKHDPANPLEEVHFICRPCKHTFACEPGRVEEAPERTAHPWMYFANCPQCDAESPQQPWEMGLMASYGKHTGPKTDEGKARVTKNIDGYPTPEQTKRLRFNSLKHGMYADVLEFFPARPGQYLQCKNCQIDRDTCLSNTICAKEADRAMRYQIAFDENDPSQLRDIYANNQSRMQSILDNMMLSIINTGTELKSPVYVNDKDGGVHFVEKVDENGTVQPLVDVKAHPLLKNLGDFISKNSLSMADMGMTPKLNVEEEPLQGNLDSSDSKADELLNYQAEQTEALKSLRDMIAESQKKTANDPILIEHGGNND